MALPSDRAHMCTWGCYEALSPRADPDACTHKCAQIPCETMALRLEGRKGPTYEERKMLPPLGMFKERMK